MIISHWLNWTGVPALRSGTQVLTYPELHDAVTARASWLTAQGAARMALCMDNSIEWVVTDLALQMANLCCVPVPDFFSAEQQAYLLEEAQIDLVLSDTSQPEMGVRVSPPTTELTAWRRAVTATPLMPSGTGKITFTSGSTGSPKGVCLSHLSQTRVAQMLVQKVGLEQVRHLCLLPLPTLLENIAGVYAPLLAGGEVVLASRTERGFSGSQLQDATALLSLIGRERPETLILIPALLQVLLGACQQGWTPPDSLKFIAVGGARVAPALLDAAHQAGLPVYEGYGLSEAVSVSTLNVPGDNHANTVGSAVGHNHLSVEQGELVVQGNIFLGYLNQPQSFYPDKVYTGDLGSIDNGIVRIQGRKKNLIINAFGRNISPEWVESELLASPLIGQAVVSGDAMPFLTALIVAAEPGIADSALAQAIMTINARLPDYARIKKFARVALFTQSSGLVTASGKLRRDAVLDQYADTLTRFYLTSQYA